MLREPTIQLPDIKHVINNPKPHQIAYNPELNELWIYNAKAKQWARMKMFMDEEEY